MIKDENIFDFYISEDYLNEINKFLYTGEIEADNQFFNKTHLTKDDFDEDDIKELKHRIYCGFDSRERW